jgi:hypothetical protein
MFNESIRWIKQSLLDAEIGGAAALFFNIARGAADPPTNLVGQIGYSYSTISSVARWPWRAAELARSARIA